MSAEEAARDAGLTAEAQRQTARGDVRGGETWPMVEAASMGAPSAPPVGLSWTVPAGRLGVDPDVLRHDGSIILIGDTFPEAGYFFDPERLSAQRVDVGQRALSRGYFLGRSTVDTLALAFEMEFIPLQADNAVRWEDSGPVIALFADRAAAERGRDLVLRGSLGAAIDLADGPLGTEVTVRVAGLPGRVATALASMGGAIIAVSGTPVRDDLTPAYVSGAAIGEGDAPRGGTGVTGDVPGPEPTSPPRLPS